MSDLISRQAAIKAIEDLQDCYNGFSDTYDKACIIGVIEEVPPIEPVKHGAWGENIYGYRKCSVCGRVTQVDECMREPLYLYCPYCGARLDETPTEEAE